MAITWPYKKPATVNTQVANEIYTPPNWSNQTPQLYCITYRVPVQQAEVVPNIASLTPGATLDESVPVIQAPGAFRPGFNSTTGMCMLVFDAIKRAQHGQTATVTQHPLQTGFNISDHVVRQPNRFSLEVAMSDAIASYTVAGHTPMWSSNPSKSVSAFQQMTILMDNRQLLTLNSRLQTYNNMVLIDISAEETARTYFGGLAMTLTFQQVIIADISVSYESARMQASNETAQGTVQPQAPTKAVTDQHKVGWGTPSAPLIVVPATIPGSEVLSGLANWIARGAHVPGSGTWTSNVMNGKAPGPIPLGF